MLQLVLPGSIGCLLTVATHRFGLCWLRRGVLAALSVLGGVIFGSASLVAHLHGDLLSSVCLIITCTTYVHPFEHAHRLALKAHIGMDELPQLGKALVMVAPGHGWDMARVKD